MLKGKIVVPGEKVENEIKENIYFRNGEKYSQIVGLIEEKKDIITPLNFTYLPKVGDKVIGIIEEIEASGWFVNINAPHFAFLPLAEALNEFVDVFRTDLSKFFNIGEIIYAKIINIIGNRIIQVSIKEEGAKLEDGVIIKTLPSKVPRIIGKNASMLKILQEKTNCKIIVGNNGLIWVKGEKIDKVYEAIKLIEKESHLSGLTEKVAKLLENG